jgi:hypothetical protein
VLAEPAEMYILISEVFVCCVVCMIEILIICARKAFEMYILISEVFVCCVVCMIEILIICARKAFTKTVLLVYIYIYIYIYIYYTHIWYRLRTNIILSLCLPRYVIYIVKPSRENPYIC